MVKPINAKSPAKSESSASSERVRNKPSKSQTAAHIEYTPEQVEHIGAKLDEFVVQANKEKITARVVIRGHWPKIQELLKSYPKRRIYEMLTSEDVGMTMTESTFYSFLKELDPKNKKSQKLQVEPSGESTKGVILEEP